MDVSDYLRPGCFAINVRVKITGLPKLPEIASQLAESYLLEHLEKLRHENARRLVDEQMNMFGHQYVSVNPGLMTCPCVLQNGFNSFLRFRRFEERKPVKAAERAEMKSFRSLEPLQAIGHTVIVISLRLWSKTRSSR